MSTLVENGYPIFTDKNGDPLESGYIFIGEANLNPISNPQTAYWDAALTIPAANIRTSQGYPVYNGSPSRLYVEDNYSIVVQDKEKNTIYTLLDATGYITAPSPSVGFDNSQVVVKSAATITVKAGSTADVNGTTVEVLSDTDLQILLADTDYYIRLSAGGSLSLQTSPGTFNIALNGRYDAGDRILNWKVYRDSSESFVLKLVDPYNLQALYQMDQNVETDDDVTLNNINSTGNITVAEGISTDNAYLKTKIFEIGVWNMVSSITVGITHGFSDITKIRGIEAIIQNDLSTQMHKLNRSNNTTGDYMEGNIGTISSTTIGLWRRTGGFFDNTDFNNGVINRGWVKVTYEV